MQTTVSRVGWAMPVWLRVTVYFAAGLVILFGGYAAGLGGFSALIAIAGGYLALWLANRLCLRRNAPPDPGADNGNRWEAD